MHVEPGTLETKGRKHSDEVDFLSIFTKTEQIVQTFGIWILLASYMIQPALKFLKMTGDRLPTFTDGT